MKKRESTSKYYPPDLNSSLVSNGNTLRQHLPRTINNYYIIYLHGFIPGKNEAFELFNRCNIAGK